MKPVESGKTFLDAPETSNYASSAGTSYSVNTSRVRQYTDELRSYNQYLYDTCENVRGTIQELKNAWVVDDVEADGKNKEVLNSLDQEVLHFEQLNSAVKTLNTILLDYCDRIDAIAAESN